MSRNPLEDWSDGRRDAEVDLITSAILKAAVDKASGRSEHLRPDILDQLIAESLIESLVRWLMPRMSDDPENARDLGREIASLTIERMPNAGRSE